MQRHGFDEMVHRVLDGTHGILSSTLTLNWDLKPNPAPEHATPRSGVSTHKAVTPSTALRNLGFCTTSRCYAVENFLPHHTSQPPPVDLGFVKPLMLQLPGSSSIRRARSSSLASVGWKLHHVTTGLALCKRWVRLGGCVLYVLRLGWGVGLSIKYRG